MPANNTQIVDVAGNLSAQSIHDAGYLGRQWYLARPNGGIAGLTPDEANKYFGLGLTVSLNYERDSGDWMADGYNAGVDAGNWIAARVAEFTNAGIAVPAVYISADSHFNAAQLDQVVACLKGVQSVIGAVGRAIYGFVETMDRIHAEGLADYYWQCGSENDLRPWVQLYQRNNDNDTIAGVTVDCNDIKSPSYAQLSSGAVTTAPAPAPAPAAAPAPAPAPAPSGGVQVVGSYTVQSGDNLTAIAKQYPQAWITADSIAQLNGIDPNVIYAGQVLQIGGNSDGSSALRTYTVQSGDNLTDIAKQYPEADVTADSIAQLNGIDPNVIYAGQVLQIPN